MSPITPQDVIARIGELPSLPHVAAQVIRIAQDPDATANDLQRVISTDQALTAQILRISNSAMFGKTREVKTLSQAIMTLGFSTIMSVVLASGAKALMTHPKAGLHEHMLWEHSVTSALASSAYGRVLGFPTVEEVFLAGLLHDIGKVVLSLRFPDQYVAISKSVYNGESDLLDLEFETFGFDHAMVGGALLYGWNIAPSLENAVRWHHDPGLGSEGDQPLLAVVALGNQMALDLNVGLGRPESLAIPTGQALSILQIDAERFASYREEVISAVERDNSLLTEF